MTIRVSYDTQIFRFERRGGISRYFTELVRAIRADPTLGIAPQLSSRVVASRHLAEAGLGHRVLVPRVVTRAWNRLPAGPRDRVRTDLVHHTYYLPRELQASWQVPRVTTIHDMIPEMFPDYFPKGNPHQVKRSYVEQSSGLVFVSETSKRDLLRIYGGQDVPMAVAPLAPGAAFYPRCPGDSQGDPFVVFVGTRVRYKQFGTLLDALALMRSPALSLVAVGGGSLNTAERDRIEELGLTGRVRQASLSDEALAELYTNAVALVVPSRYEGFGLPVAEAMATGCPVVVSDIEAFREVADQAAEYFPVGDASELAAVLERMHADRLLRKAHREAGLLRARDFTWARTARITASLYAEVMGSVRPTVTQSAQGL